ncbi:MAG: ABC transporter ATP-binding protein [bacterium]
MSVITMGNKQPVLEFNNVTKTFGDLIAVDNLNLTLKKGDFLGLLGPNGAGKTTAIHLATGLATLERGTIKVLGHDVVDDYTRARRKLGLAPQEPNFDRFFPIKDLLVYQAGYFGIPKNEAMDRADELLELFELKDKREAKPDKLSGGQKRRLLLAKALIHNPQVVILDEPTAGLDVELRHKLWDYLKKLKSSGKTILLTTHYIEEVEALADRVAMLNEGRLILEDSIENVMNEYGRFRWIFKLDKLPGELARDIEHNFEFLTVEDSTLQAHGRELNSNIMEVLGLLNRKNITIEKMKVDETPLEEIFLQKVKG